MVGADADLLDLASPGAHGFDMVVDGGLGLRRDDRTDIDRQAIGATDLQLL